MEKRFDCVFEREEKGIFMNVEKCLNHIDFGMYEGNEIQVSVCLRKKETEELIKFLQDAIKEF
jgi:hypothetical protein